MSMITDSIGLHKVLLPINLKNTIFEKFPKIVLKIYQIFSKNLQQIFEILPFFVELNYNFECDWLIELFNNNFVSESWKIGFLNQVQWRKL